MSRGRRMVEMALGVPYDQVPSTNVLTDQRVGIYNCLVQPNGVVQVQSFSPDTNELSEHGDSTFVDNNFTHEGGTTDETGLLIEGPENMLSEELVQVASQGLSENVVLFDEAGVSPEPTEHTVQSPRKYRVKRRLLDKNAWRQKKHAQKRENGLPYKGKRKNDAGWNYNILKAAKHLKPACNCKLSKKDSQLKCAEVTEDSREKIFTEFWQLSWESKKTFVRNNTTLKSKTRTRQRADSPGTSRRINSVAYFLNSRRVCKKMFISTINVPENTVLNWIKEEKSSEESGRNNGTQQLVQRSDETSAVTVSTESRRSSVMEAMIEMKCFLESLPKMPSHYCRSTTSKKYLEPIWSSKNEVYRKYKEWASDKNVHVMSTTSFLNIFDEMNLSIFQRKKDECEVCVMHRSGNLDDQLYNDHISRKERARVEKNADKSRHDAFVYTMDMQAVLLSPKSNVSAMYYKTKLAVHNFCLYDDISKHGYCYLWNETEGGLSSSEFASIIYSFLLKQVLPLMNSTNRNVILWSDGCTYQNRNSVLSNALLHFAVSNDVVVVQKYLEKGHTQMEVDSMHSAIEQKLKKTNINVPGDYIAICQRARPDNPYKTEYLDHTFFKDINSSLKFVTSIRPGKKSGDPTVTQIRAIEYSKEHTVRFKLHFDEEWSRLPQRIKIPPQLVPFEDLRQLYSEQIRIKKEKYQHLQQLKSSLPKDYHGFYDNLPFLE